MKGDGRGRLLLEEENDSPSLSLSLSLVGLYMTLRGEEERMTTRGSSFREQPPLSSE